MDIKDFLIDENKSLVEAMRQLDAVARKVLFVLKDGKFSGALTDGDIRRWILQKGQLDAKVKEFANYHPKFIFEKDKLNARPMMKNLSIEALPILNKEHQITSIVFWNADEVTPTNKLEIPMVMMAGGKGTRLYPYTKILPKPLIPIGEIPIAEHIVNRFRKSGVEDFYFIVNHKKNMIKAYFNEINKDYNIYYEDEEEQLGTGGGLSLLKGKIQSTFILSNCDILIEEDYSKIYEHHKKQSNLITMVCSLQMVKIPYGVVEISDTGDIEKMIEKPEISFFTNTGVYIVEPRVIEEMDTKKAVGFPDIIQQYKDKGEKVGVYPISENAWMDMGQIEEMERMRERIVPHD